MRRHYLYGLAVTDPAPGWRLGSRVLPRRWTVTVGKYKRFDETGKLVADLTPSEAVEPWIELEIASSDLLAPHCVAMFARDGITTEAQRFPLAGLIAHASATIASRDGSFLDLPLGLEYDDALWEATRAAGRRRPRGPITDERLKEVAQIAREHPGRATAAVQAHFRFSRGYARKLIKRAEAAGLEIVGTS